MPKLANICDLNLWRVSGVVLLWKNFFSSSGFAGTRARVHWILGAAAAGTQQWSRAAEKRRGGALCGGGEARRPGTKSGVDVRQ